MAEAIAALATSAGPGAIGVVRLSGVGARAIAGAFLRPGPPSRPRRAELRWAMDGAERLDRVLATWFPEGSSYTGEETVEISAHGSPYVLERLLELCLAAGARAARPGEFTLRAYLAGRLDLGQAEAVCDLIASRTRLEHRAALRRLEGGLSRLLDPLRSGMLQLAALAEAALDHPDEGVAEMEPAALAAAARRLAAAARTLAEQGRRGRLPEGAPRVCILGRPNAGKSSLLNALLGRDRAIVSALAGTTRDTLEEPADLEGLRAVLVDTAGLRDPQDEIEREGVARTRAALRGADLALLVLDRTVPLEEARPALREAAEGCARGGGVLLVALNKADLSPARVRAADLPGLPVFEVSAARGSGVPALAAGIAGALGDGGAAEAAGLGARHERALLDCGRELDEAAGRPELELAAAHLRRALACLDSIDGRRAPEEVLAEVFARFCVGK